MTWTVSSISVLDGLIKTRELLTAEPKPGSVNYAHGLPHSWRKATFHDEMDCRCLIGAAREAFGVPQFVTYKDTPPNYRTAVETLAECADIPIDPITFDDWVVIGFNDFTTTTFDLVDQAVVCAISKVRK